MKLFIIFGTTLITTAWSAIGTAASKRIAPTAKPLAAFRLEPFAPESKLDIPVLKSSYSRTSGISKTGACLDSCGEVAKAASYIDSWGSRYANKKWLEERLRKGRTLPAPILRWQDFQMHLLIPMEGRLDMRALPMGALFRIRLPDTISPTKTSSPPSPADKKSE